MSDDKIILSDDPSTALQQIASYLKAARLDSDRQVCDEDEHEVIGYWQTPEYITGLHEIAEECERVSSMTTREKYRDKK